jgi:peptide/nickel transport system permease protein
MGRFVLMRLSVMVLTALCLTFAVFLLTNLPPNLEKMAKTQVNTRMTDAEVELWLERNGYKQPVLHRYGEWLGVVPGWTGIDAAGQRTGRCVEAHVPTEQTPRFCGVMQGKFGYSTVFRTQVETILSKRLALTGWLMFWVMVVMVPTALLIGVLAGMREGSRLDRSLSMFSIVTTATPEYVSGVVFIAVFASAGGGLKWFKASAASAMEQMSFENFALPVMTMALYGMGYIARMTRASMAEVMTSQYIRTAHLKGLGYGAVVVRHALRNALIAPFTVIMLQFPWLLTGVVIVETLFSYKGFGWMLVYAADNNDIELLLSCSIVAVVVVLLTQLVSDIGYVYLNPRLRLG